MKVDLFKDQREKAEVLECGLKVLKGKNVKGSPTIHIWKPKAIKPYATFYFNSIPARESYLEKQIESYNAYKKIKEERKKARKGTDEDLKKIQVGSIFHYSWGYDQTNCEFFQVIEKKGRMVIVKEISQKRIGEAVSCMSDYKMPIKDSFLKPRFEGDKQGQEIKKKIQFSNGKAFLSFDYGWCSLWDGEKKYCSWYA